MTLPDEAPPELAPLETGVIDVRALARLFADLASEAVVLSVRNKGAPEQRADAGPSDLARAHEALLSGTAAAAQIRYVHRGTEWWDTVLRHDEAGTSFRVVRYRPPGGADHSPSGHCAQGAPRTT